MFYEPAKKNHGLPFDPFKAIVAPRPIGWISSETSGEVCTDAVDVGETATRATIESHPRLNLISLLRMCSG